jgi:hypothetical protein
MKYFSYAEFDSPDFPDSGNNMDKHFLRLLDNARQIAGIPFKINSGFRTPKHNEKVGGTCVNEGVTYLEDDRNDKTYFTSIIDISNRVLQV